VNPLGCFSLVPEDETHVFVFDSLNHELEMEEKLSIAGYLYAANEVNNSAQSYLSLSELLMTTDAYKGLVKKMAFSQVQVCWID